MASRPGDLHQALRRRGTRHERRSACMFARGAARACAPLVALPPAAGAHCAQECLGGALCAARSDGSAWALPTATSNGTLREPPRQGLAAYVQGLHMGPSALLIVTDFQFTRRGGSSALEGVGGLCEDAVTRLRLHDTVSRPCQQRPEHTSGVCISI